jgi:hypothetical protein
LHGRDLLISMGGGARNLPGDHGTIFPPQFRSRQRAVTGRFDPAIAHLDLVNAGLVGGISSAGVAPKMTPVLNEAIRPQLKFRLHGARRPSSPVWKTR